YSDSQTGNLKVEANGSASLGNYIQLPNGGGSFWSATTAQMATYNVNITQAGDYVLHGRVIADTGNDNSFYVQIDNGVDNLWDTSVGSVWNWEKVSDRSAGVVKVYLTAGAHTIKIKGREDGTKLDKLLLTNDSGFIPSGVGGVADVPVATNTAPVLGVLSNQSVLEGASLTFNVASSDVDGDSLTLSVTLADGSSISTIGASFVDNLDGTGVFSFSPALGAVATHSIQIMVSDGFLTDAQNITIDVLSIPNTAPVLSAVVDQSVVEGDSLSFNVLSSDVDGDSLSLSASLLDGSALSTIGASFVDNGDGTGSFSFVPSAAQVGSIALKFSVTDGNLSDQMTVNVVVTLKTTFDYIWLESEYSDSQTGNLKVEANGSASLGNYIQLPNGGGSFWSATTAQMATYNVNITQAGDYVLHGRVIADTGNDNSFYVQIDNGVDNLWDT
ncbi:hypothetical protein MNBD_BACTEROID05-585, partial [hydrothermal vent metagenome]